VACGGAEYDRLRLDWQTLAVYVGAGGKSKGRPGEAIVVKDKGLVWFVLES